MDRKQHLELRRILEAEIGRLLELANDSPRMDWIPGQSKEFSNLTIAKMVRIVTLRQRLGTDLCDWLPAEEAVTYLGNHAYTTKRGTYVPSHHPDYALALECFNEQLEQMGLDYRFTEKDLPTEEEWDQDEKARIKRECLEQPTNVVKLF